MSVTLVDVDATWVNPSSVSYNASELRLADASLFAQAGIVRNGSNALGVSVDGSDVVTVQPGSWVIPGNAVAGSGIWRGGIASSATGSLEARDATYGRIDLVVARQLDTDVVASHAAYTGRVEIIKGTPSATPGVPALPSMAVELGRITVPAAGGAAASMDSSHRTYATGVGAEIVVPSASVLPTTGIPTGQRAYALDTGMEYRWDGSTWDDGTYKVYTPTLTNITKGGATVTGRWRQRGKTVDATITFTAGSTTSASGTLQFSLPVAARSDAVANGVAVSQQSPFLAGVAFLGSTTVVQVQGTTSAGSWNGSQLPPSGKTLVISFRYEAA